MAAPDPTAPPLSLLTRYGPDAPAASPPTLAESVAYCRGLATSHYENFSVLTSLVPERLRDDFAAVYAFCRWADDLADETGYTDEARARSLRLLAWWRDGVREAYSPAGAPAHPVYVALRSTIDRHAPPIGPFLDLIDAFEQDQRVTRYETWDGVVDYCRRSANPVGRLVLHLGGYPDTPENADRYAMSDATCTALQLVNFWQDVRRDLLERDRVYIPLAETGFTAEGLRYWAGRPDDPAARLPYIFGLRPLVERTAELFHRGRPLPGTLSTEIGPVVRLFGAGGEAILRRVMRGGCGTLWERPALGRATKVALLARAWVSSRVNRGPGGRIKGFPGAPAGDGPSSVERPA